MFLYIDDKIITSFQWIIRQIELFTQFTRKDVGTVVKHIQLIFGALCVLTGTLCLIFGIKESLLLLISFPIFGLSVFHNSIAIDITQQKESNGILPENIVREYKLRRLTASIMLNFFMHNDTPSCCKKSRRI